MNTPQDRQALYDNYFSTHYGIHRPDEDSARRNYQLNYGPFLPADKNAPILDAGCGSGLLLRFLVGAGYTQADGVDISGEQIRHCKESGLERVQKIDDLPAHLAQKAGFYQVIFLTDVLEHIPKELTLPILSGAHQALAPGGCLVVRVPNLAAFSGPYRRYMDFTHEVGFAEMSLSQVFRNAGFQKMQMHRDKSAFRSRWKGMALESARRVLENVRKAAMYIECTGDQIPTIYSKNLIGVAYK